MFLSSVDNIIYEYIESVHLACQESFCQRNGNFFTLFANNYESFVYITMNSHFCISLITLLLNIQILVNHSRWESKPFYI